GLADRRASPERRVSRTTVLLVGRGAAASRVRTQMRKRGWRVRAAADCGAAVESLRDDPPSAVVLDVAGAGFGAASFRELVRAEHPSLALFEVPDGAARRADDLALFLAHLGQAVDAALHREDQEVEAEAAAADRAGS